MRILKISECSIEFDNGKEKRKIEFSKILLDTNARHLEQASDAIKSTLMDIDDLKCELDDMRYKLTQKYEQREDRR